MGVFPVSAYGIDSWLLPNEGSTLVLVTSEHGWCLTPVHRPSQTHFVVRQTRTRVHTFHSESLVKQEVFQLNTKAAFADFDFSGLGGPMDKNLALDNSVRALLRVLCFDERNDTTEFGSGRTGLLDTEVVALIHENPNIQATELIKILGLKPTTMQSVIDRLAKRNLIKRDTKLLKGRAVALSLSEAGEETYAALHERDLQNCELMLSILDQEDRERFVRDISKMANVLESFAISSDRS